MVAQTFLKSHSFFDQTVLVSVSSLLVMGFFVFMCIGKKKKYKDADEKSHTGIESSKEIGAALDVIQKSDSPLNIENVEQTSSPNTAVKQQHVEIDILPTVPPQQYDPSKSQTSIVDPYSTIDKNTRVDTIANEKETSGSGSGNSDSGNGLYAKVKKVEKKEEIAYAVVDIKDSQDKYDTVNGGIVRRLTQPDTTAVSAELENAAETIKADETVVVHSDQHKEQSSANENEAEDAPMPLKLIDAYAVVIKADKALVSCITPEEKEDSGASGFYAQVNEDAVSPHSEPPPLPPPHPHHPMGAPPVCDDVGSYEPITNTAASDLERCNTYDSISEYKTDSKGKKVKSENQGEGGGGKKQKHSKHSKHHKSHKKQDSIGDATNLIITSKSPKNRFSRVNPFKSSKKRRKASAESESETPALHANENDVSDPFDVPTTTITTDNKTLTLSSKDKASSLPNSARKSGGGTNDTEHSELGKTRSSPRLPPPLPSVEQLIHLTQHQKGRRASSFDACSSSPELSPKSSPRPSLDTQPHSQPHHHRPKTRSVTNESSRDSRSVFSDASDNYPVVCHGSSSMEPSFEIEEDDKYTSVDNEMKQNILVGHETVVVEDDKYTKVDENVKKDILCERENVVEEDDKYTKVDENLKKDILSERENVVEEDDKYTKVDENLKKDILSERENVVEEDDKYTKVDENLKQDIINERENVVEEDDKYTKVDENLKQDILNERENVIKEDDKYTKVDENLKQDILNEQKNVIEEDGTIKADTMLQDLPCSSVESSNVPPETLDNNAISHPEDVHSEDVYAVVDLVKKAKERERLNTISQSGPSDVAEPVQHTKGELAIVYTIGYEPIVLTTTPVTTTTIQPNTDCDYEEIGNMGTSITSANHFERDKRYSTNSDYMYVE